jgi:hypothetical protein
MLGCRLWTSQYARKGGKLSWAAIENQMRVNEKKLLVGERRHASSTWPVGGSKVVTWLILPVVICLSQRLSHACPSINKFVL